MFNLTTGFISSLIGVEPNVYLIYLKDRLVVSSEMLFLLTTVELLGGEKRLFKVL